LFFTGCKDEDENQLTVPTEVVTGVTFTDTDQVEGVYVSAVTLVSIA